LISSTAVSDGSVRWLPVSRANARQVQWHLDQRDVSGQRSIHPNENPGSHHESPGLGVTSGLVVVVTALLDDHNFLGVMMMVPMVLLDDHRLRLGRSRIGHGKDQTDGSQSSETQDELSHVQSPDCFCATATSNEWLRSDYFPERLFNERHPTSVECTRLS
jgi:hypothetical protein